MKGSRRLFFKQIAGTFGLLKILVMNGCGLFPPIWKGEKSSSDFFRVLGGWCMTGFQKQVRTTWNPAKKTM